MKRTTLIYGSIACIFATFIIYYLTGSEVIEDIATVMVVGFLLIAVVVLMCIPIYFYIKQPIDKTYTIKKGNHYSGKRFRPFFKKRKLIVNIAFHKGCRYKGSDQLNEQINKAVGFGELNHHKNSTRLGWRYNSFNDNIDLFNYEYINGKRTIIYNKTVEFDKHYKVILASSKPYWFGKYLFPYFGGKEPAPHNVKISVIYK
tara:strand:- start:1826 stop:2431 length:606 start_codon:yes stop_codon:yes gene_type:complete